ncbi:LysE family translocator [Rhizobium sp. BK376]|jgi:threonine/homoserine/homoserine lactone efflux protein|uniref:LysE family translocator n=1 Tax=Rhizobium sp. BK376 TaxID=2512149 RepID=UPI0010500AB2|nr:LysE family translocator [Rhizobium sp. BK376]TCR90679.1 threonine/homoserine/homoserine lactone efflux protein [Rhizobium sp. BK376]
MSSITVFLTIAATLAIGAMSPGPSFVLVSRISISRSRKAGLAAAFGMGAGGVVFATLALLGLTALLMQLSWLYLVLKIAGGLYLVYLAVKIWQGATQDIAMDVSGSPASSGIVRNFAFGLATQLSNPKTAVVYASIFAALLPAHPPLWLALTIPPTVFCIEAGWYSIVAVAFSSNRPRAIYIGLKRWIDRLAGVVIGGLGIRLIAESLPR